jgi:uncharacterized membrane protein YjfL (UPF0719 family)
MRLDFLLGIMAEALLILIAAKLVRDAIWAARGYRVNEAIVTGRSPGAAVAQAGYLVGVLLGFLGAISGKAMEAGFIRTAVAVAVAGVTAIVLQIVADLLSDRLIFRGVESGGKRARTGAQPRQPDQPDQPNSDGSSLDGSNLALAVGKAAVSVATGLVLRGALSDASATMLGRVGWFAAAQLVMVLAVLLYCRLTPYDDLGEIRRQNLAAGFPIAGILLAVGLVMETAVAGRASESTQQAAVQAAKFLGVSLVLVYAFRLITDFVMLPKLKLHMAIVEQKNVGAGIQEGISFVLASLIVTFFLT